MAGKSSAERDALERQNAALMAVFERAGFDHIAPDIIQPADIFLERSGEDIRARTFVFTDPSGAEMCLRPDLTVPACRYHLSHAENPAAERRYCYLGPAFRFPDELLSPQEFTQAGLEWFGAPKPIAAEARVLKLTISALEAAGLSRYRVSFGDLGLFSALLDDTDMPERWRQRLQHHFWRPHAFRELLDRFCAGPRRAAHLDLAARRPRGGGRCAGRRRGRDRSPQAAARRRPRAARDRRAPRQQGRRPAGNAARRAPRPIRSTPISPSRARPPASTRHFAAIAGGARFTGARDYYAKRLFEMEELGLNPRRFHFAAGFGRELEYYTGFTFQIEADTPHGPVAVAGGGRYDNLLSDMGSPVAVPAVGCAIHTDRLKAVLA